MINKEILKELENNFESAIWQRGKKYYKEGLVSNVILNENIVNAKCLGNNDYKMIIK